MLYLGVENKFENETYCNSFSESRLKTVGIFSSIYRIRVDNLSVSAKEEITLVSSGTKSCHQHDCCVNRLPVGFVILIIDKTYINTQLPGQVKFASGSDGCNEAGQGVYMYLFASQRSPYSTENTLILVGAS